MPKILAAFLSLSLLLFAGVALAQDKNSDDGVYDAVRVKLAGDQLVGTMPLNVAVDKGVVTLTGSVEKESYRSRAEKVAKKVKGVKQVVNNIEIKTRASSK